MKAQVLIDKIAGASSSGLFANLYGEAGVAGARDRYLDLAKATVEAFPEAASDLRVFTAAGRTELGGNHTDHNRGKVLAASIQLDAVAFVTPRTDTTIRFRSAGYPDVVIDIADTAVKASEAGTTEALVRGIASEFQKRGITIGGWTANAHSTVLSGSGLSSSAAIEVLVGAIFNGLYNGSKLSAVELAQIGQKAENVYFGKPCGLMDQVACASGGAVAIDFADPAHPIVSQVDFNLEDSGYVLCVVDTGGSHADLTGDYAAVPTEMKAVAKELGVSVLRETSRGAVIAKATELRKKLGDRPVLRALHFFADNDRVTAQLEALRKKDIGTYLAAVNASGESSWCLLQNVTTPNHPEEQGVALALALTKTFLAGEGACRVHGGGFAGTIQAYIPHRKVKSYIEWMAPVFGDKSVTVVRIRPIGASELTFQEL